MDEETSPEPSLTSGCAVGGGNFNYRWKTPADYIHFQLKCQWVVVKSVGRGFVFSTSVPFSPCRVHEEPREQPPCRCSDSPCVEGRPAVGAAYLPSGPCGERRRWGRQEVWPEAGQNKQNKKEEMYCRLTASCHCLLRRWSAWRHRSRGSPVQCKQTPGGYQTDQEPSATQPHHTDRCPPGPEESISAIRIEKINQEVHVKKPTKKTKQNTKKTQHMHG